ncbi:MAG: GatB/YqeY domain-containing protein [Acidimicrobiia bacterium]
MTQQPERIQDRMRAALPAAMKARDKITVAALRSALAAIENAGAVATPDAPTPLIGNSGVAGAAIGVGATEVARRDLSEAHVTEIVRGEIAERQRAAATYEQAGRYDRARALRDEAAVLTAHLGR